MGSSATAEWPPVQTAEENPARARILSAAFAVFKEHGFAEASTLEIATLAKVSKRELYALFGSKQQMLITCIAERSRRMRLPADWPAFHDRQALAAGLEEFGSVLMKEVTDPDVIAVFRLAVAEAERSPEVAQALNSFGQQASGNALKEIFQDAQSAGLLIRADPDRLVARFKALLLEDLVLRLALGLGQRPSANDIRRRAREATEAFLGLYPQGEAKTVAAPRARRQVKAATTTPALASEASKDA